MTKRGRYIWLAVIGGIGAILAWGAWDHSPGQDPDNQGGYTIVLLFFLILLFIYVPVITRSVQARLRRRPPSGARPSDDPQAGDAMNRPRVESRSAKAE